jgi:hypothetical protein
LNQSSSLDPAEKKTGHFHNLAEILAGVVTDGSDNEQSGSAKNADPSVGIMKKLQSLVS